MWNSCGTSARSSRSATANPSGASLKGGRTQAPFPEVGSRGGGALGASQQLLSDRFLKVWVKISDPKKIAQNPSSKCQATQRLARTTEYLFPIPETLVPKCCRSTLQCSMEGE